MGVPAFFRWLTEKYPKILTDVLEERHSCTADGVVIPPDATNPNPSGLECDNLYIDMNGIIHPCAHPENGPQPKTEEEMFVNVCNYVDRLFYAARPRKLLYLAIDGVAPRSKCNQQRARRFRTAQEVREHLQLQKEVATNDDDETSIPLSKLLPGEGDRPWDSNVITPGTPFMVQLASFLRFYIRTRISTHPAWKQIRVIFSDASIPGEGEHKIMAHIRQQRAQPGYDPNVVHVLHGLDADLIMLALATHEAHFYILREEVVFGRKGAERLAQQRAASGFAMEQRLLDEQSSQELQENKTTTLQRLSIPVLREYLRAEFASLEQVPFAKNTNKEVSFERVIDDFVFLCFFVGNDFLPHLPSLDIRDGALDFLINVYKRILPSLGDYITNHGGEVNLSHVDVILAEVGAIEDHVFTMRHQTEQAEMQRRKSRKRPSSNSKDAPPPPLRAGKAARVLQNAEQRNTTNSNGNLDEFGRSVQPLVRKLSAAERTINAFKSNPTTSTNGNHKIEAATNEENAKVASELKASLFLKPKNTNLEEDRVVSDTKEVVSESVTINEEEEEEVVDSLDDDIKAASDSEEELDNEAVEKAKLKLKMRVKQLEQQKLDELSQNVKDNVRLHEKGWKDRYYSDKFKADDIEGNGGRENLYRSYVMGLVWVMKYYYSGVCSWRWYYPFHYAPFASDLKNIERFSIDCQSFEISEPFAPVEQLMAVLPSDSSHAVPKASRWLMIDPESPIIDFYPKDVPTDPNGKAMPWLWVVLLPFIDEKRLLDAMKPTMEKWSAQEQLCNSRGLDDGYLYVHLEHPLAERLLELKKKKGKRSLGDPARWGGFSGSLRDPLSNEQIDPNELVPPPKCAALQGEGFGNFASSVLKNMCLCAAFTEPPKRPHKSIMLMGAAPPLPALEATDFVTRRPRLNFGGVTIANLGEYSLDNPNFGGRGYGHGAVRSGQQSSHIRHQISPAGGGHPLFQPARSSTIQAYQMQPQGYIPMQPQYNLPQGPQFQPSYNLPYGNQPYVAGVNQFLQQQQIPFPPTRNGNRQQQGNQTGTTNQRNRNNPTNTTQQQLASTGSFHQQMQHGGYNLRQQEYQQPVQSSQPIQFQQTGFPASSVGGSSGYSFSRNGQGRQWQTQPTVPQPPPPVNPSLMNSLRSQLASTLNNNRKARGNE